MKNITIADVAKLAGVSKSTVSQFLNKRYEYMSELTRERIELAVEELDYRPNIVARSLTQKSTFTVGVIVANILHSFSTHIIRAIENKFYEHGFHIIVCNADDEPDKEKEYINAYGEASGWDYYISNRRKYRLIQKDEKIRFSTCFYGQNNR